MTTPLLYASVSDLRSVLGGTDSGVGTAAQLTDSQLTLALMSATNRVSAYVGNVFDSTTPQAVPPALLHDLTLDIAAFWATATYLKNKEIPSTHPVYLKYTETMKFLNDVRDGKVRFDPVTVGGIGEEVGVIINRIPNIFSGEDSNTQYSPETGGLEASTPDFIYSPRNDLFENFGLGPLYQG